MHTVKVLNTVIFSLFLIFYSYQIVYIFVGLFRRQKPLPKETIHRIAVLIAARNEAAVIGALLDSIHTQHYPAECIDIFVVADNCTDNTAQIAAEHGAVVYERQNKKQVGKGYALQYLLSRVSASYSDHDAYVVFDADNILHPDFIREINRCYSNGYEIVTCYRNSKNYGDNWISAGYALWFLREARYINGARMLLGNSCAITGTGFLFSRKIMEKCGGWNFFLLTEDMEFTAHNVVHGEKVGYAEKAIVYDEQPTTFAQSWRQRLRWAKGFFQVFHRYGKQLVSGASHGSFSCYDLIMNIMPAAILSGVSVACNVVLAIHAAVSGTDISIGLIQFICGMYFGLYFLGIVTTITEWDQIYCSAKKKILYTFTFPIFMLTYIPIAVVAIFSKVEWKPIHHSRNVTLEQITNKQTNKANAK